MSEGESKGGFQADIPADAVQEALRSVERIASGADPAPAAADAPPASAGGEAAADPAVATLEAERTRLAAELELSQRLGRETQQKLAAEHDRCLRLAADLENYRKRAARERDEVQRFGNEKLLKDILPVVDGLDRALAAAAADDPLRDGVKLVRAALEQTLARHGVVAFSAMGERFDPTLHEALLQVPTREQPPGTVVLEHARGFKLNDRLVRPAMVGVSVEPPADGAAGPSTN